MTSPWSSRAAARLFPQRESSRAARETWRTTESWNQEKQKVAHAPANDPSGYVNCGLNPAYEHGDLLPVEQQRVVV
jgi:hypothetical protein